MSWYAHVQVLPKRTQRDDGMADSPEADSAAPDGPHAAPPEAEACPVISRRGRQLKQVQRKLLILYLFLQAEGHVHLGFCPQIRRTTHTKSHMIRTMPG